VSHIFFFDTDALHTHFFNNLALKSPGLEALADVLTCLPNLRNAYLKFHSSHDDSHADGIEDIGAQDQDRNDLLRFSFSGMRQTMLYFQVQERLQANNVRDYNEQELRKFGDTFVVIEFPTVNPHDEWDKASDFERWQELQRSREASAGGTE